MVKSASDNTNYYTAYFGDNVNFCLFTCKEFCKTGMLYKNIITVVLVGKKTFSDLSVLYLEHPLMNLQEDFFQNFQENEGPRQVDLVNSGKSLTLFFPFRPRDWCVYREEVRRARLV